MNLDWLMQIAPTIATALGGPLAGLAVEAVAKALGVKPEDAKDMLANARMTADQLAQVKVAEIELKKQAQALGLEFEKLATQDRGSAREMQMVTKSLVPAILTAGITAGFFAILLGLMSGKATQSPELLVMLGSLGTAWAACVSFWFGSSAGSQTKDLMLYNAMPPQPQQPPPQQQAQ